MVNSLLMISGDINNGRFPFANPKIPKFSCSALWSVTSDKLCKC